MLDGFEKSKSDKKIRLEDLLKASGESKRPKLEDFKIKKTYKVGVKSKSKNHRIKIFKLGTKLKSRILARYLVALFLIIVSVWFFSQSQSFTAYRLIRGFSNKSIIIGFQNSAELRPTGGFWGSFVYAKIPDNPAQTELFFETNPYKNDNPLLKTTSVDLPKPMAETWTDRPQSFVNANWPIDFSQSAKTIEWYFGQGWQTSSDGVVAVSSLAMIDLLDMTGPVTLTDGTLLTSKNFTQIMSQKIDVEYWQKNENHQTNEPKTIIKEMFPQVLQKAKSISVFKLYKYMLNQMESGRILVYFNDQKLNKIANKLNISGEVLPYQIDYLSINNANLNGGKSSLNIYQSIALNVSKKNSSIISSVDITRSHEDNVWPVAINRNYTRVFVPLGSKLIKASLEDLDITQSIDVTEESGRTVYGFWFNLGQGEQKKANIQYEPPYKIDRLSQYKLVLQKQPGTNADNVEITIFGKRLFSGINSLTELSVP